MPPNRDIRKDPTYLTIRCLCACALCTILVPPSICIILLMVNQTYVQCSIQDFYIASNTTDQSLIYFDLKLQNSAERMVAYYDNLNLTFSYYDHGPNPNPSTGIIRIANYTIHGFHQGEKQTHRKDFVLTPAFSWEEVSNNGSLSKAVFRADLATRVRFRYFWKGKRSQLMAWANVEVNGTTGKKIKKKGITLKDMHGHDFNWWVIIGLFWLLVIILSLCYSPLLLSLVLRRGLSD